MLSQRRRIMLFAAKFLFLGAMRLYPTSRRRQRGRSGVPPLPAVAWASRSSRSFRAVAYDPTVDISSRTRPSAAKRAICLPDRGATQPPVVDGGAALTRSASTAVQDPRPRWSTRPAALSRLSDNTIDDREPLIRPAHRKVQKALDAEAARQPSVDRGLDEGRGRGMFQGDQEPSASCSIVKIGEENPETGRAKRPSLAEDEA